MKQIQFVKNSNYSKNNGNFEKFRLASTKKNLRYQTYFEFKPFVRLTINKSFKFVIAFLILFITSIVFSLFRKKTKTTTLKRLKSER